jgi:acetate kinase
VSETIVVVNAGSSSIKVQLFSLEERDQLQRLLRGQIEGIGVHPRLVASGTDGQPIEEAWPELEVASVPQALDKLVAFLRARLGRLPTAIGHRVVHGGPDYSEPTVIDDAVLERLEVLSPLAPLHQPNNLAPIRAVRARQVRLTTSEAKLHRKPLPSTTTWILLVSPPRERPICWPLLLAMQAPCWCTRTIDVSIICTAAS